MLPELSTAGEQLPSLVSPLHPLATYSQAVSQVLKFGGTKTFL